MSTFPTRSHQKRVFKRIEVLSETEVPYVLSETEVFRRNHSAILQAHGRRHTNSPSGNIDDRSKAQRVVGVYFCPMNWCSCGIRGTKRLPAPRDQRHSACSAISRERTTKFPTLFSCFANCGVRSQLGRQVSETRGSHRAQVPNAC